MVEEVGIRVELAAAGPAADAALHVLPLHVQHQGLAVSAGLAAGRHRADVSLGVGAAGRLLGGGCWCYSLGGGGAVWFFWVVYVIMVYWYEMSCIMTR